MSARPASCSAACRPRRRSPSASRSSRRRSRAFGVPIDKIIEAGVGEIQALEGYIRRGAGDTQKVLDESNRRIELYENEIKSLRTVMEQRVQEQQVVTAGCNAKKLDVQRILEFFGQEAVAKVVRESPSWSTRRRRLVRS